MNIREKIVDKLPIIYILYSYIIQKKYKYNYDRSLTQPKGRTELLKNEYIKNTKRNLRIPPIDFNEKMQFSKMYNASSIKTELTDKYLVRNWVKKKIGEEYLIPLLGKWDSFDQIDFLLLPEKFVLKTNNGSGTNLIVKNKKKINIHKEKIKFNSWLKQDFSFSGKGYEMHYSKIKPCIIAEELIECKGDLPDYKFICFDGKPYYCWIDKDRFHDHRRNIYDMEWRLQPWQQHNYSNTQEPIEKPEGFDRMVEIATILSKGFDHVRVDLYNVDGKIYFGEMTFTDGKGFEIINPQEYNDMLGSLWNLEYKE